jgi:hypothetical protein
MTTNPSDPQGGPAATPAPEPTGTLYQAPPGQQAEPVTPPGTAPTPPPAAPPAAAAPPTPMDPNDEKTWATLTHLSPLLGFVTGILFVAPVILYFVLKDRGPFIRHHVAESLNAIISLGIYSIALTIAATLFTVVTLGFGAFAYGLLFVLGVVAAVFWIIAAVETNKGRWYRYPLVIRFVR